MWVTPRVAMVSGLPGMDQVAPLIRAGRPSIRPSLWTTSPGPMGKRSWNIASPAAREPRVWTTALGWEVVPEVKITAAGSFAFDSPVGETLSEMTACGPLACTASEAGQFGCTGVATDPARCAGPEAGPVRCAGPEAGPARCAGPEAGPVRRM